MRHRCRSNNFGRKPAHRKAMLMNMVGSLITHGRVKTTPQKAKAARQLAEKMITLAKKGTLAARRRALSILRDKGVVHKLFSELAPRFASRNGGYTRILRLPRTIRLTENETAAQWRRAWGLRLHDGAEQVYLEFLGYLPPKIEEKKEEKVEKKVEVKEAMA